MRMEDLKYLQAIACELNIGKAALSLGISQPALSKSLQRLERELGFTLFQRTPKGVEFTQASHTFYERIQQVQNNLADAIKEAEAIHLGALGVLRIGISPLYIDHPFVRAAAQLRKQRPAVHMEVTINLNDVLIQKLKIGELDLTINALDAVNPQGIHQEGLFNDDLCIAVREDHPLSKKRELVFEDLVGQDWMLPRSGVSARRQVDGRFAEKGLPPPQVAIEVSSTVSQLVGLVRTSDLLIVISERMLSTSVGQGLSILRIPDGRWSRKIGVMTREGAYMPSLATRFIEILRENA